jgi:hypothetical protein
MASMTSGSSFELSLVSEGAEERFTLYPHSDLHGSQPLSSRANLVLRLRRPKGAPAVGARLSCDGLVLLALDARVPQIERPLGELLSSRDAGLLELLLETPLRGGWRVHSRISLPILDGQKQELLRERLLGDLQSLDSTLIYDALGLARRDLNASTRDPISRLGRLERQAEALRAAVGDVGRVLRSVPRGETLRARWRPGLRLERARRLELVATPAVPGRQRSFRPVGADLRVVRLSHDLGEHRQIKRGLQALIGRARGLSFELRQLAEQQSPEEHLRRALSADERGRALQRCQRLESLANRARAVASQLLALCEAEEWLLECGPPRSALVPTPLFRRVPAYAAVYRLLAGLQSDEQGSADALVRVRPLSELFEIWCCAWLRTALHQRLQAPADQDAERDRTPGALLPLGDLRPGDRFDFPLPEGGQLALVYQPLIPGAEGRQAGRRLGGYVAAFTRGVLRPDLWIEVRRPGQPPRVAILDAKCTWRFEQLQGSLGDELEMMRDYRMRIHDPVSGHQPVRAVFQVHPGTALPLQINLLSWDRGLIPPDAQLCGAVPAAPGATGDLARLLDRLLNWL